MTRGFVVFSKHMRTYITNLRGCCVCARVGCSKPLEVGDLVMSRGHNGGHGPRIFHKECWEAVQF